MGSSCGTKKSGLVTAPSVARPTKAINELKQVTFEKQDTFIEVKPTKVALSQNNSSQFSQYTLKELKIGHYFMESELKDHTSKATISKSKNRLDEWRAMAGFGVEGSIDERIKNRNATPMGKTRYIDVDCDVQILEADAEIGLSNFKKANPRKFSVRVGKGAPTRYRWLGWKIQANIRHFIIPGKYDEYKTKGCLPRCLNEIEKDIGRTFPEHPLFSIDKNGFIGQEALKNVLKAYACYNSNVGYCQGMNFIVGFLLIISGLREEETFWMFVALANYKITSDPLSLPGIDGFYIEYFPLLKVLIAIFDMQFHEKIPELKEHFDNTGFDPVLWLHKWFQTLFLYSYPLAFCIRIWDAIFSNGISFIIPFSLTMLRLLEKSLLEKDFSAINDEIKNIKENTILPFPDYIIKQALKVRVDWKTLDRQFLEVYRIVRQEQVEYEKEKIKRRSSGANLLVPSDLNKKLTHINHKRRSFQDLSKEIRIEEIINTYEPEKGEKSVESKSKGQFLPQLNIIRYESKHRAAQGKLSVQKKFKTGKRSPNRITFSESRRVNQEWWELVPQESKEEELKLPPLPEPKPFIVEDKIIKEQIGFIGLNVDKRREREESGENSVYGDQRGLPPSPATAMAPGEKAETTFSLKPRPLPKPLDILESLEKLSQASNSSLHSSSRDLKKKYITLKSRTVKNKRRENKKKALYTTEKNGMVCIASIVKYGQEIEENIEGEEGEDIRSQRIPELDSFLTNESHSHDKIGKLIAFGGQTYKSKNILGENDELEDLESNNSPTFSHCISSGSHYLRDSIIFPKESLQFPQPITTTTFKDESGGVTGLKFGQSTIQRRESEIPNLFQILTTSNQKTKKTPQNSPTRYKSQKVVFISSPQNP